MSGYPALSAKDPAERRRVENTLFARFHDPQVTPNERQTARSELVEMHQPLVHHIARRYADRGEPFDDVFQVGNLGLISAVDRFDPERGVAFSSFAVPTITGAIRRHFRDATWALKVPRRVQESRSKIHTACDVLTQELGRSPTIHEIAERCDMDAHDVLDSLELSRARETTPIDTPISDGSSIADRIGDSDHALGEIEDKETVRRLLDSLPKHDREVVVMRFFDGMSQTQIAEEVGVSQMQVSRILGRSLARLRSQIAS
jgi:RNA polymerase sigma-B factor